VNDVAWTTWTTDLPAIAGLAGVTAAYLRGYGRRRAAGTARPRRLATFLTGVAVTLLSVTSPVATVGGQLLWAHMVQHLSLTVVAAPLLALGAPIATIRQGLPPGPRHAVARGARRSRRLRRRIGDPPALVVATAVHIVVLWVWHAPGLYDAAVTVDAIHGLEHVLFLSTAVWVWSEVVATARRSRRFQALATLCLGALIAQGGVLGALLTFAGRSVYAVYTGGGGLSALEDQQLGGALMWVPPGFVYAVVAVRRFAAWIDTAERDLATREARARSRRPRADAPAAADRHPDATPRSTELDGAPIAAPPGRRTV
jgi:cytochrome c oxidase assembly factor CtaG